MTICGAVAIVVAGGVGTRLGLAGGKQLAPVLGVPVLSWTLKALDAVKQLDHIVVVCPADRVEEYLSTAIEPLTLRASISFAPSGETRQASVSSGLSSVQGKFDIVVVHDGARPLIDAGTVARALSLLDSTPEADGVVVGHPVVDTLKVVEDGWVRSTPDRSRYWIAQTPQLFRFDVFESAMRAAEASGLIGTDDATIVEVFGGRVLMCEGPRDNIKVTVSADLACVEATLERRSGGV